MSAAPITAEERRRAERMARELVIPGRGEPLASRAPMTRAEKYQAEALVRRLVEPPADVREDIRNLAGLAEASGETSGGLALGLWAELREVARRHPAEFAEETGGDPAAKALELIASRAADRSRVAFEGIMASVRAFRAELEGPDPSPLESRLAEAVALAWLDHHRCLAERESSWEAGADLRKAAYLDARVDRSHRRYLRSIQALAAVRKLGLPSTAIQINVGTPASGRADRPATEFPGPGWTPELDRPSTEE